MSKIPKCEDLLLPDFDIQRQEADIGDMKIKTPRNMVHCNKENS
jgi:hypothetical protein